MGQSQKALILLDMDGVVANFWHGAAALFNTDEDQLRELNPKGEYHLLKGLGLTKEQVDAHPSFATEKFWVDLPVLPWAHALYNGLKERGNVVFLTKPMLPPECWSGKLRWLRNFTGDPKFRDMIPTHLKHLLARSDRILVDDCEENCSDFYGEGGYAVLFPRYWNKRHALEAECVHHTLRGVDALLAQYI